MSSPKDKTGKSLCGDTRPPATGDEAPRALDTPSGDDDARKAEDSPRRICPKSRRETSKATDAGDASAPLVDPRREPAKSGREPARYLGANRKVAPAAVPTLKLPRALAREGFVVWFHDHGQYLGLAWNDAVSEIEKAHVDDADHAIYFDTFAQAAVACEKYISPCRVLHSPGPGKRPKLMG
ncbi:hypothetical protein PPN31119_02272 [Pandoraea pnomenusa]|uniref:Uncharacterized protein n=1 Tax=Pandoraea pnomenusa TaxID=93220 RepID=A0ABY6WKW4_9BURK|nr:hypothetical protein [Pandoraea pnomenusa]AIM44004.1 hypothetical protein U875_26615 [Pandoraea pnomenusa 3kgm]VVE66457.1 hypothetical protein PPN31119_02272 [Pandoraea pnomenusa]